MGVDGISTKEHAAVQSVPVAETLTNRVDRVPFNPLPFNGVWLEDALGRLLDFFGSRRLAWMPVGVGGRGDLDVEANHVVLSGDDHDGAVFAVNGTFHLQTPFGSA